MARTYEEELEFLTKKSSNCWTIKKGFVPNMKVLELIFKFYRFIN